jgi:hypothetical protein
MYNFNRDKQHSYSVFLTPDQARALNDMVNGQAPTTALATDALNAVKSKLRVLLDAIRKRESRPK